jgi:protease-4
MAVRGGKAGKRGLSSDGELEEKIVESGSDSTRIALISLHGLISSSAAGAGGTSMVEEIKTELRQAEKDPAVKAVVLSVDSPGGEVTASDILYNAVRRVVAAHKPVVVSMGSLAASGGYYVSCGGSWLMANDTTFTGSIGVIIQTFRYNDLLGKIGIAPVTFKSGAFKDMLSGTREMTPAEKEYVQGLVMQTYGKFVGIVAKQRRLPEEQLRAGIADGRVVSGKDALAAGLIDEIGEVEDAYHKARDLAHAPGAAIISYEAPFRFGRLLRAFGADSTSWASPVQGKVEINLIQQLLPQLEPGKAYLLPSICVP